MFESIILCGRIHLGKQGENHARKIPFEFGQWENEYGEGRCELLHQRNGDEVPYPVALTIENNVAYWCVNSADTAFDGEGKCELRYIVDDVVVKSATFITSVAKSLGEGTEEPPEVYKPWVDQVLDAAEEVKDATTHQPIIGENGNWFVWDAETESYIDTGVSASSGGGMTEEDVKKLLEDTAPKDHTHDVAEIVDETVSLVGITTYGGASSHYEIKNNQLFNYDIATTPFTIDIQGIVTVKISTSYDGMQLYVDGNRVDANIGLDDLDLEYSGEVKENIQVVVPGRHNATFDTFTVQKAKDGFMSGEHLKRLENTPTKEEVNNLIAEAFGTVEAVFDEVHEYAESLGGDEA
jgi:hypothetical protein